MTLKTKTIRILIDLQTTEALSLIINHGCDKSQRCCYTKQYLCLLQRNVDESIARKLAKCMLQVVTLSRKNFLVYFSCNSQRNFSLWDRWRRGGVTHAILPQLVSSAKALRYKLQKYRGIWHFYLPRKGGLGNTWKTLQVILPTPPPPMH